MQSVEVQRSNGGSRGIAARRAKHWFEEVGDGGTTPAVTVDGVEPSPAGPADLDSAWGTGATPPVVPGFGPRRAIQFSTRQGDFVFRYGREFGETFAFDAMIFPDPVTLVTHPDHARSLFLASPDIVSSTVVDSPLRPIVGDKSVITANGDRHRRQRKLLMPSFHGESVANYRDQIVQASRREIDSWKTGTTIQVAVAAQRITLDVILAGIFGIDGELTPGSAEDLLRQEVIRTLDFSVHPLAKLAEVANLRSTEPVGLQKWAMNKLDRSIFNLIRERRARGAAGTDILSVLLATTDEDGVVLTDKEIRDELVTLVLAGHETTANTLAWACERLVRHPEVYARLKDAVRSESPNGAHDGVHDDAYVEATIHEVMRVRPVVPIIGRRVAVPWQLGEWTIPAGSRLLVSILLLQHRPDLYPNPFAFEPQRFVGVRPTTNTWLPFGGGTRRCLGAALAMEELRIVLRDLVRRTDMEAVSLAPEKPRHRNVTMIPGNGGRVRLTRVD
jgi:cytochrome P450